jgi:hypothetical protein
MTTELRFMSSFLFSFRDEVQAELPCVLSWIVYNEARGKTPA